MSQATNTPAGTSRPSSVHVAAPAAGANVDIATAGQVIIDFDPSRADFERTGNNLVITSDNGGKAVIVNFFVTGGQALPEFVLPDKTEVAGADLLQQLNPEMDLSTAAGPSGASSSGAGAYDDNSGDLLGGLDRLGSLGTDFWGRNTTPPEPIQENLIVAPVAAPIIAPLTPVSIGIVPTTPTQPPEGPGTPEYSLELGGANLTVNEAFLPGGSQTPPVGIDSSPVAFLITSNNGLSGITLGGTTYAVQPDGTLAGFPAAGVAGMVGSLTDPHVVDLGGGQYRLEFTYSFTSPFHHEGSIQGTDTAGDVDSFTLSVVSLSGVNSNSVYAHVDVIDDVPVVTLGLGEGQIPALDEGQISALDITAGTVIEGSGLSGTWSVVAGADGPSPQGTEVIVGGVSHAVGEAITTSSGVLTVNADNTWTFAAADDVYASGDRQVTFGIRITDSDGDVAFKELTFNVADDRDATRVVITPVDTLEGTSTVDFNIQLSNPPQAGSPASVTVDVGGTVYTVALDATGAGVLHVPNANAEDVYIDPTTVTATVTSVIGGNFEAVDVSGAAATAHVGDTINTTTVGLSITPGDVLNGAAVTITATVNNVPILQDLVLTLSNGATVTIPQGSLSGSVTVNAFDLDDGVLDNLYKVSVVSAGPNHYENLDYSGAKAEADVFFPLNLGEGLSVDESYLPMTGSGVDTGGPGASSSITDSGSFTLSATALAALTVSGATTPDGAVSDISVTNGLVVYADNGYMTFSVTGNTVGYTFTLTEAFTHTPNTGPDQTAFDANSFEFKIHGTAVGDLGVNIEDDAPTLNITDGVFQNGAGTFLEGTLAKIGADFSGAHVDLSSNNGLPVGVTSGGVPVVYSIDPSDSSILYGKAGTTLVFTITGHSDGTYSFLQAAPLDLSVLNVDQDAIASAGGPQAAYYIHQNGTFDSNSGTAWAVKVTGTASGGGVGSVNPSTQGMDIGNNLFQTSEKIRFEIDDEGASGQVDQAYLLSVIASGLGTGESITWVAHYTDGLGGTSTANGTFNGTASGEVTMNITAPSGGWYIDDVEFTAGTNTSARLTGIATYTLDDTQTKELHFGFTAHDGDNDTVSGSVTLTAQNSGTLTDTSGTDALAGGVAGNSLTGGSGDNILHGGSGHDLLTGGSGHDLMYGDAGNDTLHGGLGNDTLHGGSGNDLLYGEGGNDVLLGGTGNDTMHGGPGDDVFAWKTADMDHGTDSVMDFSLGHDRLSFSEVIGTPGEDTIPLASIQTAVSNGTIDVTATDATHLTVHVETGGTEQTVTVTLADSALSAAQLAELQVSHDVDPTHDADKAALLQQMLTSITS